MAHLPTGSVTFLLTDIEGSTALWERDPDAMWRAVARHDQLIAADVREHGGAVVKSRGEGDSAFAVFPRADDAVRAAHALQRALLAEPWPAAIPLRVRIALHTGPADLRDGDYYGEVVNRCARLRAVGHGGQILLSEATAALVREGLPPGVSLRDLGEHRLRHLTRPERVFQVLDPRLPAEFPRLTTVEVLVGSLRPGGERREMTILFADLRGFSGVADALAPEAVFALLSEYVTAMSDVIQDHQGIVDKYMGDGLMAFWGAPTRHAGHAALACRAALAMLEELRRLNEGWARAGRRPLGIGIGVNTGPMLVGNMGSLSRVDYTVLGDTVNVGGRLEALTREYGAELIVGEATLRAAGPGFCARFLDVVALRGRAKPVAIHELLPGAGALGEHGAEALRAYGEGMDLCRRRDWRRAAACFREALRWAPGDRPSALHLERCERFIDDPPPAGGSGLAAGLRA